MSKQVRRLNELIREVFTVSDEDGPVKGSRREWPVYVPEDILEGGDAVMRAFLRGARACIPQGAVVLVADGGPLRRELKGDLSPGPHVFFVQKEMTEAEIVERAAGLGLVVSKGADGPTPTAHISTTSLVGRFQRLLRGTGLGIDAARGADDHLIAVDVPSDILADTEEVIRAWLADALTGVPDDAGIVCADGGPLRWQLSSETRPERFHFFVASRKWESVGVNVAAAVARTRK
jgi:hypothetical protein